MESWICGRSLLILFPKGGNSSRLNCPWFIDNTERTDSP